MAGKKKKAANLFWRITISLVGLALILLAVQNTALFFWGETAVAQVNVRRTDGARDGSGSDRRYSWSISYEFSVDGQNYQGHTSRRGSDLGVKVEPEVFYFAFWPRLNALADSARPGLGQLVLVGAGVLLLVVMNKPDPDRKKSAAKIQQELDTALCWSCGQPLATENLFCAACGAKI